MYKCRECKAVYKEKVDYCECGNNTFDEMIAEKVIVKSEKKIKEKLPADKLKRKSETVSWIFFTICVILSTSVWLFAWNVPKQKIQPKKQNIQQQTKKNIPNIDKIWDDTPIYKPAVRVAQPMPQVINSEPIPLTSDPYPRQLSNSKEIMQQLAKPSAKTKPENRPIVKSAQVSQPVIKQTPKPVIQQQVPQKAELPNPDNDPDFIRYKSNLRSVLFSKFAVGSIKGSGSCTIEFSINDNGKLEGRKFIKQSDNKELNDSVYYMLMSVPVFSPPPSSYNGEKIRMQFYLNNGYYEVSFI